MNSPFTFCEAASNVAERGDFKILRLLSQDGAETKNEQKSLVSKFPS